MSELKSDKINELECTIETLNEVRGVWFLDLMSLTIGTG